MIITVTTRHSLHDIISQTVHAFQRNRSIGAIKGEASVEDPASFIQFHAVCGDVTGLTSDTVNRNGTLPDSIIRDSFGGVGIADFDRFI